MYKHCTFESQFFVIMVLGRNIRIKGLGVRSGEVYRCTLNNGYSFENIYQLVHTNIKSAGVGIMLFTIAVIIFIIYGIVKWSNKNEKKNKQKIETNQHNYKKETSTNRLVFPVVGLNYEGRQETLTKIVNEYQEAGKFTSKPYQGLTDDEILKNTYKRRVYELNRARITECYLIKEDNNKYDPNALMVWIRDIKGNEHHIGYVPREMCEEIRSFMNGMTLKVFCIVTGGRYKFVDSFGDNDKELFTSKDDYGLKIYINTN